MKHTSGNIFSTRSLAMMGALTAIEIILARYLSIQTETLRVSFETIPIGLAGMWLGPVAGALVALISDILGTVIAGYGIYFPPLSLGPMAFGILCGVSTKYIFHSGISNTRDAWKVIATAVTAGIVNSFVIGLAGVTLYQVIVVGRTEAFGALFIVNLLERLATKPLTIVACAVCMFLINRAAYRPVIQKILGDTGAAIPDRPDSANL